MFEYAGSSSNLALFGSDDEGIVVDINLNLIVETGDFAVLSTKRHWSKDSREFSAKTLELVEKSSSILYPISASAKRLFTIPSGVQSEAKKALEWHAEHHRGGTPVGLNTARILAKGGQIGLHKIHHIAKYFPRHEVDKKATGYNPGEDNFPSNGRIAWALWGGDAARRWVQSIIKRESSDAIAASGLDYYTSDNQEATEADYSALRTFKTANDFEEGYGPEFIARIRLDGAGIDRLYMVDANGDVSMWDDCRWDNLGNIENDIWSIDAEIDASASKPFDYDYILVDPASAVSIAASLEESPYGLVSVESLDPEEAELFASSIVQDDLDFLDLIITASGASYSEEEISALAKGALKDATGKSIAKGLAVIIGGDSTNGRGVVVGVDKASGAIQVKLDNGKIVSTRARNLKPATAEESKPTVATPIKPMDTTGILGEKAKKIVTAKASIPITSEVLDKPKIDTFMSEWAKSVVNARAASKQVVTAASPVPTPVADPTTKLTPKTSDVTATYFAIVSPDDTSAVMDLVALIPATAASATPMTYKRHDKQWILDEQILRDLQSATPPPVVPITQDQLQDVLKQVDGIAATTASITSKVFMAFWGLDPMDGITAAGSADRNRGNAEKLRRYWVHGEGAAKIRWGTPGDWRRCVLHLEKYLGERAKGYCQLRHKEAMGVYTATHAEMDRKHG
jgi:hypothetical protein